MVRQQKGHCYGDHHPYDHGHHDETHVNFPSPHHRLCHVLRHHCLVRPYLGRRRRLEKQSKSKSFSLRNYPLHIDQIEELKLDGKLYARIMAETLAHLYWGAHMDANDVEFVLAPPREGHSNPLIAHLPRRSTIGSETLGEHVVWILDFDCCRPMTLDAKGVGQAVAAFFRNDPYYP